jgi:hypothetical protein
MCLLELLQTKSRNSICLLSFNFPLRTPGFTHMKVPMLTNLRYSVLTKLYSAGPTGQTCFYSARAIFLILLFIQTNSKPQIT